MVDPYTGKQVKEGKSKAPLGAASVAVGKPWSYALRGQCILTGTAGSHDFLFWCENCDVQSIITGRISK